MAKCDINSLTQDSGCFFCLPPGYYYPLKLALLCRWWKQLAPGADCSVNALMADAKCFECLPPGELGPLKLALLCKLVGGGSGAVPVTPTNLDIANNSTNGNTILTWSQSSAPPNNLIERNGVQIAVISGAQTTYTDIVPLGNGAINTYRVRGQNGGVMGGYSNTVSAGHNIASNNTGSVTLSFPDLVICYGTFLITNEAALTSLSVPKLRVVTADININACGVLPAVSFPALISATVFQAASNPLMTSVSIPLVTSLIVFDVGSSGVTSLSLPALLTVAGDFAFSGCPALTSVTCNSLNSVGNRILGFNSPALVTLSLPALVNAATLGPGSSLIDVHGCTSLTSVSMPNVIITELQLLNFDGDNLNAASVNQVLARGVASNVNSCDFELANGTNAAPTGQGIADKTTLLGRGNTVNTN